MPNNSSSSKLKQKRILSKSLDAWKIYVNQNASFFNQVANHNKSNHRITTKPSGKPQQAKWQTTTKDLPMAWQWLQ
jgi:hypothetical protein